MLRVRASRPALRLTAWLLTVLITAFGYASEAAPAKHRHHHVIKVTKTAAPVSNGPDLPQAQYPLNGRFHVILKGEKVKPAAPVAQVAQIAPPPPPPPPAPAPPPPPPPPGPQPDVVVALNDGQLGGDDLGDGTFVFKAVPFARPPVGDLRWTPPQEVKPWTGVRYRQESAPGCLQASYGWNDAIAKASSEDCLYLEIRTPELVAGAKKPVMVFFHGGANRAGAGSGTVMSPLALHGVVVVSIQYRLGVFGFLSHPALTAESRDHASGNYALMDQVKALQWIRANIAQFGGDPDNVTLFGHSAGGQDVGLMLATPLAHGLFARAIEESGTPQFGFAPRTLSQNEALGIELARSFTTSDKLDSAAALADLRHAPAAALQTAADKLKPPMEDDSFIWDQAVVDGYVLPKSPQEIFKAGEGARVDLLVGVSARELTLHDISESLYGAVNARFGNKRFKLMRAYGLDVDNHPKPDPVMGDVAMQMSTDIMLRCPSDWMAARTVAAGQKAWLYQLDVTNDAGPVHHGSELNYVFNARPDGKSDGQWPPLMDYWLRFAKTGDPNGPGLAEWPAYGDQAAYAEFATNGVKAKRRIRGHTCELFDRP